MTRSNPKPLAPLNENLNCTLRLLARERELAEARRRIEERGQLQVGPEVEAEVEERREVKMAANQNAQGGEGAAVGEQLRTMGYYMTPRMTNIQLAIRHPPESANNFEINPSLVTMIKNNALFHGLSNESPREHVQKFIELAGSLKINGVPEDVLNLRLFPYSLARNASRWLKNGSALSITSWDDMLNKFMTRYCPPSKTADWCKKITHFEQEEDETLRDAWERYSDYFLQCPHKYIMDSRRDSGLRPSMMVSTKMTRSSLTPYAKGS
ncbi:unnamed protein product [Linum trigynum]|uniref:Retrotransposon gag domain-containing protein n=1 Tax=Linum trigynum TaxID=586398 RepID=A0AAV2EZ61_9ROSI